MVGCVCVPFTLPLRTSPASLPESPQGGDGEEKIEEDHAEDAQDSGNKASVETEGVSAE